MTVWRLRLRPLLLLLLFGVWATMATADNGEVRIAMVVGISAYKNAPRLSNPVNDAHAIGDALRRLNFDVAELDDVDFLNFQRGLREFGIRAQDADVAVVYYAGHGVQVDHENYLLPSDAKLERERDLLYEALPLSLILGEISQAHKIGIVLLDACRNNPFIERMSRSMSVAGRAIATSLGLARVDNVPRNTMVVMATKADQVADDGGEHSPFAAALLAHFQLPGLELSLFFRSVRDTVLRATSNRQEPYVFSSLGAEPFYFYPRPPNHPPQIAEVKPLEVTDLAGPTPLGMPRPTDPDGDPLTVRITGLPRSGEVRVEGRVVASNDVFNVDKFMGATYKPDGKMLGPVGTLDILIEDGRGGNATASLPISVKSSNHPPVVEAARTLRVFPAALRIAPPTDPDNDPLTVTVIALPRGMVHNGTATLSVGDQLKPQDLANLTYVPPAGFAGKAESLRYLADDGRGGLTEGKVDIEVAPIAEASDQVSESGLWESVQQHGKVAEIDAFLRLFPNSRFADAARKRRGELAATAPPEPAPAPTPIPERNSPVLIAAAGMDAAALRDRVAQALRHASCALADVMVYQVGPVALSGFAGSPEALTANVRKAIGDTRDVRWDGEAVTPALCRAVDLVRMVGTDGGPSIAMGGPGGTFVRDGEPIVLRITTPDFPGELRVDYAVNNGTLTHLFPTVPERLDSGRRIAGQPQRIFAAGEEIVLGNAGKDKTGASLPSWTPGEPYGTDLILAVSSSVPLKLAAADNDEADAEAYFRRLSAEIERVRRDGARVTGMALLLHTLPRK